MEQTRRSFISKLLLLPLVGICIETKPKESKAEILKQLSPSASPSASPSVSTSPSSVMFRTYEPLPLATSPLTEGVTPSRRILCEYI